MQVSEIMKREVEVINADRMVQEAALMMEKGNYGAIPVEKNDRMVGMITDRDIALRVVAHYRDPRNTTVEECMSPGIAYCYEDEDVTVLAAKMQSSRHRRIPVINRSKRLVGMVSLRELVTRAQDKDLIQDTYEEICH